MHHFYGGFMALINKYDFSILSDNQDYRTQNDYFECDDLIAPAISLLNRKGYITTNCCSGHPFPSISAEVSEEHPIYEEFKDLDTKIIWVEPSDKILSKIDWEFDEEKYQWFIIRQYNYCGMFYVTFEKHYNFPELPEGAYINENNGGIYWDWDCYPEPSENFDAMMRIYEINKIFYEWVKKLPFLKEMY